MNLPVLVLGGGLTGMLAAAELAAAGASAIILERGPILGGKRAARLLGGADIDPRLGAVAADPAIEYLTQAQLHSLEGEPGAFSATVVQQPRYVTADCTRCNHCVPVCPQALANEYDAGLTLRKAIHSPLPATIPDIYALDIDACLNSPPNYQPCQRCVEVCDDNAIHFDMPAPVPVTHKVAAVIVATGYADNSEDGLALLAEFGYGTHADIISAVELQRLLEDPGPSGGFAVRPSNEGYPDSVLLVMPRVCRDAAWVMANHLRRLQAQDIAQLQVLILGADGDDPALQDLRQAAADCNATLCFGSWIGAEATPAETLCVNYAELPGGRRLHAEADLVVLSGEILPDEQIADLARVLGLALDERGYPTASRPGIHAAGGALGTVGIEAGAEQAREAVQQALQHLPLQQDDPAPTQSPAELAEVLARQGEDLEQVLYTLMKLGEGRRR